MLCLGLDLYFRMFVLLILHVCTIPLPRPHSPYFTAPFYFIYYSLYLIRVGCVCGVHYRLGAQSTSLAPLFFSSCCNLSGHIEGHIGDTNFCKCLPTYLFVFFFHPTLYSTLGIHKRKLVSPINAFVSMNSIIFKLFYVDIYIIIPFVSV